MFWMLLWGCGNDLPVQEALPAAYGEFCDADADCESNTCWQPADTGCTAVCSNGCFSDADCEELAAELPKPEAVSCGEDGYCDLSGAGSEDFACSG